MFRVLTKALIVKDNNVLLLRRKLDSEYGGGQWDFPGGKLEFGEHPLESLIREVYEETALSISIDKVFSVHSSVNNEGKKQFVTIIYLCSTKSELVILDDEHLEYAFISENSVDNYEKIYYVEESLEQYYCKD